ncbi:MAG: DUF1934 domain-containing protein [Clostridiales bacterium]|nr:DUF1934 domain-containing protein [Clostridiales bacterium]
MIKKMVKITAFISSTEDDEDRIEFTTEGEFQKKDNIITIVYEESEISGMEGSFTTLVVKDESVIMKRDGLASSEMVFKEGMRYKSDYSTSYGLFKVELLTNQLMSDFDEDGTGAITIEYDMSIRGLSESNNRLIVEVF